MSQAGTWYIVRQENGQCTIFAASQMPNQPDQTTEEQTTEPQATEQTWGPFASQSEAIARRVGLIRAGKCQPA